MGSCQSVGLSCLELYDVNLCEPRSPDLHQRPPLGQDKATDSVTKA